MLTSISAQQITGNYILFILQSGFTLGGVIGAIMGSIAWTINEKGNQALGTLMVGAVLGLLAGLFLVGGSLLETFSNTEALFMNANQNSSAMFRSVLGVAWFTLVGGAIGGAIVSLGRAIIGSLAGLVAGTFAGMILVLINQEYGFRVVGPVATILVGATTLILLVIMLVGREK